MPAGVSSGTGTGTGQGPVSRAKEAVTGNSGSSRDTSGVSRGTGGKLQSTLNVCSIIETEQQLAVVQVSLANAFNLVTCRQH